jgi:biopolymer transport protein ExbB
LVTASRKLLNGFLGLTLLKNQVDAIQCKRLRNRFLQQLTFKDNPWLNLSGHTLGQEYIVSSRILGSWILRFQHNFLAISLAVLGLAWLGQAQAQSAAAGASATQVATAPAAASVSAAVGTTKSDAKSAESPYGLSALWKSSDWVARFVLLVLVVMSVGTWYILVQKWLEQSRMRKHAQQVNEKFWKAASVAQGAASLDGKSAFRFIAESAVGGVKNHAGLKSYIPLNEWIPMCVSSSVDRVQANTQNGLAFLATVGSTSPFVGLFGTVWGIYHALTAIGISGQASIDKVAGPVGEALIMTAIGLAVAIPAVLAYNWLAKRNKAVMDEVREFSEEVNAVLVGSAGKAA